MTKKVSFNLPSSYVGGATTGILVGDFNNWNINEGIYMEKLNDGSMVAELFLTEGKTYQYRYLLSDGRWVNDDNEKKTVDAYGQPVENCVINVPAGLTEIKEKKSSKQKAAAPAQKNHNLTELSGVTKEVAVALATDNINTIKDLSKCTMKRLLLLLEEAGLSSKVKHHTTWIKQAKLLTSGKLKEWEVLRSSLHDKN